MQHSGCSYHKRQVFGVPTCCYRHHNVSTRIGFALNGFQVRASSFFNVQIIGWQTYDFIICWCQNTMNTLMGADVFHPELTRFHAGWFSWWS